MRTALKKRFDFEQMKKAATDENHAVRKAAFLEYFEQFQEFPSYLFDNERVIDERLYATMQDILQDPATSKGLRAGAEALLARLPSR